MESFLPSARRDVDGRSKFTSITGCPRRLYSELVSSNTRYRNLPDTTRRSRDRTRCLRHSCRGNEYSLGFGDCSHKGCRSQKLPRSPLPMHQKSRNDVTCRHRRHCCRCRRRRRRDPSRTFELRIRLCGPPQAARNLGRTVLHLEISRSSLTERRQSCVVACLLLVFVCS